MKEFKPRDKLTQRMTRDGAVLDNQTTGEEIHISERDAEKQLSPNGQPIQMGKRDAPMNPAEDDPKHGRQLRPQEQKEPEKEQPKPQQPSAEPFQPQSSSPISHIPQDIPTPAAPGGTAEKLFDRAAAEHDAHKARQTAQMSRDAAQQRYSASRLQFSEEERAAPELHQHIHRAEKAADKLDAAQSAIPKKRVLRKERVFDEASGTAKAKLRFDTVDKSPPKLKPNPLGRPLREVAVQAHGKIHEVEHENVGVESGHKAEELAEHGAGGAIRWKRRHRKLKPYRAAEKAERKAVNANAEYLYQKALHDNPEMLSGNPLNRFFQKQRLKREYAKAARTAKAAGSTAQATAKSAEKTAEVTATAAKKAAEKAKEAAEFVARHWKGVLVVLAGFLLVVMLIGGLQSCSALVGAAGGGVAASSYQSEDADILAAEAAYCALEAELQEYLDTYERTHDYDEYHYNLDEIKHDPYGYHHSTDDGKYLIMGNGTQAFAITAEQREQENYMRTAELSTEQNYNMIDGQINNTPSVDELEEKTKRGEVISLSALAAAVKAEDGRTPQRDPDGKKPSIRAQLKADRAQSCKPQQREKEQEAKRSIRQALEME